MGHRKKRSRAAKLAKSSALAVEQHFVKCPHSFVFHRGLVGHSILELIKDLRNVMAPFTAPHLKVQKRNVLKDFVAVAGPLGVTHFIIMTKTETAVNLRLIRLPRGPTLMFKVDQYSLARDVISSLKRPIISEKHFSNHPLLVMNNFQRDSNHLQLSQTMFQNLFPSININSVNLNHIRRAVLIHYNADADTFDLRHYAIKPVASGVSRSVKKLIASKVPNLGRYKDVSDFLLDPGQLSESEAEGEIKNEVELPQDLTVRGCTKTSRCAIRVSELGPRLTLQLVKIEEGICDGEVLYHKFIKKTSAEKSLLVKSREAKVKLKQERRNQQALNVQRKTLEKELLKQRCLAGMKQESDLPAQSESASAVHEKLLKRTAKREPSNDPERANLLVKKRRPSRGEGRAADRMQKSGDNNAAYSLEAQQMPKLIQEKRNVKASVNVKSLKRKGVKSST